MSVKSIIGGNGTKARVLVVDDYPITREGLKHILCSQDDLECCGEAGSCLEVQKILAEAKPDLMIMEIRIQGGDGLELLKTLKKIHPSLSTLVVSHHDETHYAERALKAGARGFVMKERPIPEVLKAIRTVLAGGFYVSPRIAALALHKMIGNGSIKPRHTVGGLTDRELQILQLLGAGLSSRQIAGRLFLSIKTIETHRENIKHRLGLKNSFELVRYATDWVNGQTAQHFPETSNYTLPLGA